MSTKKFSGAMVDKRQQSILEMFFNIYPWTYIESTPQELLDIMSKTEDKNNKKDI